VKYAWIDGHSKAFALTEMCVVLDVSISGYRAWKRGGHRQQLRELSKMVNEQVRASRELVSSCRP
jgi:putative transposase